MPATYCSCVTNGAIARMEVDGSRNEPGIVRYVCKGCGAPEEAVMLTMDAMQDQWTKGGPGHGKIPESLLANATFIEENGQVKVLPQPEMSVEGQFDSGRSLKELAEIHQMIKTDAEERKGNERVY